MHLVTTSAPFVCPTGSPHVCVRVCVNLRHLCQNLLAASVSCLRLPVRVDRYALSIATRGLPPGGPARGPVPTEPAGGLCVCVCVCASVTLCLRQSAPSVPESAGGLCVCVCVCVYVHILVDCLVDCHPADRHGGRSLPSLLAASASVSASASVTLCLRQSAPSVPESAGGLCVCVCVCVRTRCRLPRRLPPGGPARGPVPTEPAGGLCASALLDTLSFGFMARPAATAPSHTRPHIAHRDTRTGPSSLRW